MSLTVAVLALYLGALGLGETEDSARGLALVALIVGQLLLVLVERSDSLHVWHRLSDKRVLPWSSPSPWARSWWRSSCPLSFRAFT